MPLPSLWESDFLGLDNGHRYRLIAEDALTSCWKLENEFDDIMQAGYYYGYDFEWDGSLLITSFDSVNKNAGCSVGTSFIVIVDEVQSFHAYIISSIYFFYIISYLIRLSDNANKMMK